MKKSDYIYNLLLKEDGLSAKLKKIVGGFDTLNKNVASLNKTMSSFSTNVTGNLGQVDSAVSKTADKIDTGLKSADFVAITNATRNFADSLKTLSSSGSTFEQSMANLSASTGITGRDLDELNRIARESGVATGAGATEAANAFTQLASKVKVSKVGLEGLKTLQQETVTLSKAGGIGMTDAASALAETVNQFGLGADQANRVVNILAAGSKNGSAGIAELAASLGTTGAAAAATGVSVEQAAGALEVLSQNNQKGAEAGTALSSILTSMQSNLNMDLSQTGLSTALESLTPLLGNTAELSRIFGEANVGTAQYLIENAASVAQMTTALTDTNVAQEQAAIRSGTMAEQMKVTQAGIDNMKIGFYDLLGGTTAYLAALGDSAVMLTQLAPLFTGLGKGILAVKNFNFEAAKSATLAAVATVKGHTESALAITRSTAVALGHSVATKAVAAASRIAALGQAAWNAVMSANPIAIIIGLIAGLTAGIVYAYNKFEPFKQIVDQAWEGVKKFGSAIWDGLVKGFEKVSSVLSPLWDKLKALLGIEVEAEAATVATSGAVTELGKATEEATKATEKATEATGKATEASTDLNKNLGDQKKKLTANLDTLDGISQKITELQEKQKTSNTDQAIAIGKEINLLKDKKKAMENAIIIGSATPSTGLLDIPATIPLVDAPKAKSPKEEAEKKIGENLPSMGGFGEEVESNTQKVVSLTESIWGSNSAIGQWASNATSSVTNFTNTLEEFGNMLKDNTLSGIETAVGSLQAMGALMSGMGGIVEGSAGAWLSYGANILAMVAAALPQLLALFGVESALAVSKQAQLAFPLNIVAMAATVAGIAAAVIAIPKPKAMAQGGIVYGNTFAQVGEYPGAANNPEVVAPLNRLRQLIQPAGSFGGGSVEFVIKGNRLVGVLNKEANKNRYF